MKLRNVVLAFGFVLAAFVIRPDAAQAGGYVYANPPAYNYNCPPYAYNYYQAPAYAYGGYYTRPYTTRYYGSYYYPAPAYYPRRKHYRRAYRRHYRRW